MITEEVDQSRMDSVSDGKQIFFDIALILRLAWERSHRLRHQWLALTLGTFSQSK